MMRTRNVKKLGTLPAHYTTATCKLSVCCSCNNNPDAGAPDQSAMQQKQQLLIAKQATAMFAASAVLGPLCDGQHSSHDVLHYHNPLVLQLTSVGFQLETCWWVPNMFGLAGVILGVSYPLLDNLRFQQTGSATRPQPGWPAVSVCIALFVYQYHLSGQLESTLLEQRVLGSLPTLDALLATFALVHWAYFDRTRSGLFMSMLTAVCGPLVEIGLINVLHVYEYTHPQLFGVPTWIPWVYFCGGPAVGSLGRRVWQELLQQVVTGPVSPA